MKKVIPFTKTITFKTMIAEITDIEVKHTLSLTGDYEIQGDILVDGTYKMTEASQIEEEFHYKLPFMIDIDNKYILDNIDIIIGDFYFEIINEEDLKINVEIDIDGLEEKVVEAEIIGHKILLSDDDINESSMVEVDDEIEELVRNDDLDSMVIPVEINETIDKLELDNDPLNKLAAEIKEDLSPKKEMNYFLSSDDTETKDIKVEKEETGMKTVTPTMGSIFNSLSTEETFSTYYVYIVRESDTLDAIIDKYNTTKESLDSYNDLNDIKAGTKLIIPCTYNE